MKEDELQIGEKVRVNTNSPYHNDWTDVCTMLGVCMRERDAARADCSENMQMAEHLEQERSALLAQRDMLVGELEFMRAYCHKEVCYDEFAYQRIVATYRSAIDEALATVRGEGRVMNKQTRHTCAYGYSGGPCGLCEQERNKYASLERENAELKGSLNAMRKACECAVRQQDRIRDEYRQRIAKLEAPNV